jgi:hypothetical protein
LTKKVCFVIGPIGPPGGDIRAAADDFMKYIVAPCAEELGYKPVRADGLPEPGRITSQIIELLNSADLVIADLSGNNANVYYELSCRHAIGRPAIHMAMEGTPLPFDVADNRTIFYTMHARWVEQAKEELTGQVKRVQEPGYKARNPILDAVGLIALEKSTEPTQQAIASFTRQLESVQGAIRDLRSSLAFQPALGSGPTGFNNALRALAESSLAPVLGSGPTGHNALRALAGFSRPGGVVGPNYLADQLGGNPINAALELVKAKKDTDTSSSG